MAYLGVAASALTMFLWNYALRHVPASAAALYVNLVPVVGLAFALLFGEPVGAAQLVGGRSPSRGCCSETPFSARAVGEPGPENPILLRDSPRCRGRRMCLPGRRGPTAGPAFAAKKSAGRLGVSRRVPGAFAGLDPGQPVPASTCSTRGDHLPRLVTARRARGARGIGCVKMRGLDEWPVGAGRGPLTRFRIPTSYLRPAVEDGTLCQLRSTGRQPLGGPEADPRMHAHAPTSLYRIPGWTKFASPREPLRHPNRYP